MSIIEQKNQFVTTNRQKIIELKAKFEGYLIKITNQVINDFLCNFQAKHWEIILKLLKKVDYFSNPKTSQLAKKMGLKIKQATNQNLDEVYFCPMDSSSGSSADAILRKIRNELRLDSSVFNSKFIHVSDLADFAIDLHTELSDLEHQKDHIASLSDDDISDKERTETLSSLASQIKNLKKQITKSKPKTVTI